MKKNDYYDIAQTPQGSKRIAEKIFPSILNFFFKKMNNLK